MNIFLKNCNIIRCGFVLIQFFYYFDNVIFIVNNFQNNLNSVAKNIIINKHFSLFFIFEYMLSNENALILLFCYLCN